MRTTGSPSGSCVAEALGVDDFLRLFRGVCHDFFAIKVGDEEHPPLHLEWPKQGREDNPISDELLNINGHLVALLRVSLLDANGLLASIALERFASRRAVALYACVSAVLRGNPLIVCGTVVVGQELICPGLPLVTRQPCDIGRH